MLHLLFIYFSRIDTLSIVHESDVHIILLNVPYIKNLNIYIKEDRRNLKVGVQYKKFSQLPDK